MGQTRPLGVFLFISRNKYCTNLTINDKSEGGVLGTRAQDGGRRRIH